MSGLILTLVIVFVVLDVLWWFHARRLISRFATNRRRRRWIVDFMSAASILTLLGIIASRALNIPLDSIMPRVLVIFTLVWHLLALPIVLITLLMDGTTLASSALFRSIWRAWHSNRESVAVGDTPDSNRNTLNRRDFIAQCGAFAPVLVSGAGTVYSASTLSSLRVRELQIHIERLPSALDGLTIAHVSDTHLGRFTDAAAFRQIVKQVNELDADLVLHTGDLINDDQRHLSMACQLLREMKSRHGLFLCEGNHDLIGGRESFRAFMRNEQMPLLIDEITGLSVNGQTIEFLGLPWTRGGRTSGTDGPISAGVGQLAARRSNAAFPVLLAHHPHAFDAAVGNGIPLTFGGHTHGGQMNLSNEIGFGPAMYRYWSGLYSREGCHTVISNGAGNWFPLRINAPAEIARVVLKTGREA